MRDSGQRYDTSFSSKLPTHLLANIKTSQVAIFSNRFDRCGNADYNHHRNGDMPTHLETLQDVSRHTLTQGVCPQTF